MVYFREIIPSHGRAIHFSELVQFTQNIWWFPKMVVSQNGWCIIENPMNMDDLGVSLF